MRALPPLRPHAGPWRRAPTACADGWASAGCRALPGARGWWPGGHGRRRRSRRFGLEGRAAAGVLARMSREHEEMVDAALRRDGDGMREVMSRLIGHIRSTWAGRNA